MKKGAGGPGGGRLDLQGEAVQAHHHDLGARGGGPTATEAGSPFAARGTDPAGRAGGTGPAGRRAVSAVPATPIKASVPVTGRERRAAITFLATTTNRTVTQAITTTRTKGWTRRVEPDWYSSKPPSTSAITPNTDRKAWPASLRSSTNRPMPSAISASHPSCT